MRVSARIVFVTAFDQYAVEAFEREAVDYLVKPVTKKRLTQTIQRLKKQLQVSPEPPDGLAEMITHVLANLQEMPMLIICAGLKRNTKIISA